MTHERTFNVPFHKVNSKVTQRVRRQKSNLNAGRESNQNFDEKTMTNGSICCCCNRRPAASVHPANPGVIFVHEFIAKEDVEYDGKQSRFNDNYDIKSMDHRHPIKHRPRSTPAPSTNQHSYF